MSDNDQQTAAELINEALKPLEGERVYPVIAKRLMEMIITHFELKQKP